MRKYRVHGWAFPWKPAFNLEGWEDRIYLSHKGDRKHQWEVQLSWGRVEWGKEDGGLSEIVINKGFEKLEAVEIVCWVSKVQWAGFERKVYEGVESIDKFWTGYGGWNEWVGLKH